MADSSEPLLLWVSTCWPRLPMTMAVPVSWHIGRTPPAAMLAFFSRSRATNLSVWDASGSSRMRVGGPQEVGDVVERRPREEAEGLRLDLEERPAGGLDRGHAVGGEQPVGRLVGADREELGEGEVGHHPERYWGPYG